MRAFAIAIVLLLISVLTNGQETPIAWNENNQLRWADFSGKANDTSRFDAESFAEVKYTYTFNSPYDYHFTVTASFNPRTSWIKQEYKSDALLKHEQLHFDIAELYARKLQMAFDNYPYSSNYEMEIKEIFNRVKNNYHKTQQLYDEETNHSTVKEIQNQWEMLIKDALDRVKPLNNTNSTDPLYVTSK